jgi:pentatricopeptide repeat protein
MYSLYYRCNGASNKTILKKHTHKRTHAHTQYMHTTFQFTKQDKKFFLHYKDHSVYMFGKYLLFCSENRMELVNTVFREMQDLNFKPPNQNFFYSRTINSTIVL